LNNKCFLQISHTGCCLTLFASVLDAYVRLSDTGLGCPDRAGRFGQIGTPDKAQKITQAVSHNAIAATLLLSLLLINYSHNPGLAITSPNDTNKVLS